MTISILRYNEIKDQYCIAYFGHCNEYILLLKHLRPTFEAQFPGVTIHLAVRDTHLKLLGGEQHISSETMLYKEKHRYAYIYELKGDVNTHPVEQFVEESGIVVDKIPLQNNGSNRMVICAKGMYPTPTLEHEQIQKLKAKNSLYIAEVDTDVKNAGLVVGTGNETFYRAALAGIPTMLVDCPGAKLYAKLFHGKIIPNDT